MSITYPINMFEENLACQGLDKSLLPRYDVNILIMYAIGGQTTSSVFQRQSEQEAYLMGKIYQSVTELIGKNIQIQNYFFNGSPIAGDSRANYNRTAYFSSLIFAF